MINKTKHYVLFLFIFPLALSLSQYCSAGEKKPIGTGAASLGNVYQGKAYCPIQRPAPASFVGVVLEKYVSVGQKIKKNEILMKVALSAKDRLALQNRVDKLSVSDYSMRIAGLKRSIHKLEIQKQDTQRLSNEGMASSRPLAELEGDISYTRLQLEQLIKEFVKYKENIKVQRTLISGQLGQKIGSTVPDYFFIKAPADGYIIWESPNAKAGALANGNMFMIGTMDTMIIRIQMYEADIFNLKIGDTAEVISEFTPKQVRKAVVKSIAWKPVSNGIDTPSYYLVDLETPNPDVALKEGYKVRVMFPDKK